MNCKFYKKYYRPLGERYGKFCGNGRIMITEDGIEIVGKRVLSLFVRILIILAILVIAETLTALFRAQSFRYCAAATILAVFCIENWFLKSEKLDIQWAQIDKFVIHEKKEIISFTFLGQSILNPITLGGDCFGKLSILFRSKLPENEYLIPKFLSLTGQPQRKIDHLD